MRISWMAVFLLPVFALAQNNPAQDPGYHRHDGFYLSMNIGPAGGPIVWEATNVGFKKMEFSGGGGAIDLKIGGAVVENLILSADILGRTITGPDVDIDGAKGTASDNITASDQLVGLGITYYIMPVNIFVSATMGMGNFRLENKSNGGFKAESESGLGMQAKVGKEWWVGKNWGLGISGGFGYLSADDKSDPGNPGYKGTLSTGKGFILFNTTFN